MALEHHLVDNETMTPTTLIINHLTEHTSGVNSLTHTHTLNINA